MSSRSRLGSEDALNATFNSEHPQVKPDDLTFLNSCFRTMSFQASDCKYTLYAIGFISAFLIGTSCIIGNRENHPKYHTFENESEEDSHLFYYGVVCSIFLSLPQLIQMILMRSFNVGKKNVEYNVAHLREFIKEYFLCFISVPNIFIMFKIIPTHCVNLVQFYQYLMVLLLFMLQIHTFTTRKSVIRLNAIKDVVVSVCATMVFAFLHQLSLLKLLSYTETFKALYLSFLVLTELLIAYKVIDRIRVSMRLTEVVQQQIQVGPIKFALFCF